MQGCSDFANNIGPTWSPGGTAIAFASDRLPGAGGSGDDYEVYQMDAVNGDGPGGFLFQLTDNNDRDWTPDWQEIVPE